MPSFRFTSGERHVFRRRAHISLSVWASQNIVVKDGPYAGGRYRRDVNPYLAGIMDTWSTPGVKEVVVCDCLYIRSDCCRCFFCINDFSCHNHILLYAFFRVV